MWWLLVVEHDHSNGNLRIDAVAQQQLRVLRSIDLSPVSMVAYVPPVDPCARESKKKPLPNESSSLNPLGAPTLIGKGRVYSYS